MVSNTALNSGVCTSNTVKDTLKLYIYIPVCFLLAREHHVHFSSANLLLVNVVLGGLGIQHLYYPICRGRSMRNQRKKVLGKPRPCPQGTYLAVFFLLIALLLCCKLLELNFPKQRTLGHLATAGDQWEPSPSGAVGKHCLTLGKENFGVGVLMKWFCRVGC